MGHDNIPHRGRGGQRTTFPVSDTFLLQGGSELTGFDGGNAAESGFLLDPGDGWDPLGMARESIDPDVD